MSIGKMQKIFLRCWCEGRFQKLAKAVMDMNKISKVKGQPLGHVPCASMSTNFCQKSIKGLFFQYLLQTSNKGSYNTTAAIKDALLGKDSCKKMFSFGHCPKKGGETHARISFTLFSTMLSISCYVIFFGHFKHQNHQKYQNYDNNYHSHHCLNHSYLIL